MNLENGESTTMQGSGKNPYILKNTNGAYSCSCPAWRNQHQHPDQRTCKHLKKFRGEAAENERLGLTATSTASIASPLAVEKSAVEAPPVLLAEKWDGIQDPTGWHMSEKLDGVRAWWDGHRFVSRLGNEFFAPQWFKDLMPQGVCLDGELWLGRKRFQETVSIVRCGNPGEEWHQIKFMVFDAPKHAGTFEERYKYLREVVNGEGPAQVVRQIRCKNVDHLQAHLASVEAGGAEGLMLRKPGSKYEARRSSTLLKVKTRHDMEARVVGITQGKGRHRGVMGAVICEMPDGQTFSVGSGFSDEQRSNPPTIGSRITYSYQELTDRGVPRFPTFLRMAENQA